MAALEGNASVYRRAWVLALVGAAALAGGAALYLRPAAPGGAPKTVVTRRIDGNRWIVARESKDRYLGDPAAVGRDIVLRPVPGQDKEAVDHLQVAFLAPGSPMYAAGFRTEDRILKVNGLRVGTLARAVNLVHEVKAARRLTVQVERDGRIVDYEFDFE